MDNQLENYAKTAYQQSQQMQNDLNQKSAAASDQYNQSVTGANTAQANLSNFTQNMRSGTDIYGEQLAKANANAGYSVNDLNQAQAYLTQLTKINAGLPQSTQAMNANYGGTASNVANQLAGMQNTYAQGIAGANSSTANILAKQQAGLSGAATATSAGVTTQDQQRQAYTSTAANAVNVMQQSQVTMNGLQSLAQNQGTLTAQQQQTYQQAVANHAAAQASYAQASYALAQADQTRYATQSQRAADAATAAKNAAASAQPQNTGGGSTNARPSNNNNQDWLTQGGDWLDKNVNNPIGNAIGGAFNWMTGRNK